MSRRVDVGGELPTFQPDPTAAFEKSVAELDTYLRAQFEERRRRPSADLIGALVSARDGRDALSDDELFSMVVLLLAAGHETPPDSSTMPWQH